MAGEIEFRLIPPPELERGGAPRVTPRPGATDSATGVAEASFGQQLGQAIGALDKLHVEADGQAEAIAQGGGNLHEVALAFEKADVAMRLATKVRNKVLEAYNEIMRMSV